MSAEKSELPGEQVDLQGRDPTEFVAVERPVVHHARAIATFAMSFADDENDQRPGRKEVAKHINRLSDALDRDELPGEQVADFQQE